MTYEFEPGSIYRMPTHFGPRTGPRQGPDGRKFSCTDNPKMTAIEVRFLSNAEQLEALLPPRFSLRGEPVVSIVAGYTTDIEWLAGRGYNRLDVRFPATFNGEVNQVNGSMLCVLWENLADPIITGRDELGVPKIYCEIPEPIETKFEKHCIASWLGFKFLDLHVSNLRQLSEQEINALRDEQTNEGDLHLKYIPKSGAWGESDVSYVTHIPAKTPNRRVLEQWSGEGTVQFHNARWEDMPTQYNIVNALHGLEIREYRGASVTKTIGGKDLGDVRILR